MCVGFADDGLAEEPVALVPALMRGACEGRGGRNTRRSSALGTMQAIHSNTAQQLGPVKRGSVFGSMLGTLEGKVRRLRRDGVLNKDNCNNSTDNKKVVVAVVVVAAAAAVVVIVVIGAAAAAAAAAAALLCPAVRFTKVFNLE